MKTYELTKEERFILASHYENRAKYMHDCESTNRHLSSTASACDGHLFIDGPLVNEPATSENWIKRAEIFKNEAEMLSARARYFYQKINL